MRPIKRHFTAVLAGVTISALVCPWRLRSRPEPRCTAGKLAEIPDVYKRPAGTIPEMVDTAKYKKSGPYKIGFSNCSTTTRGPPLLGDREMGGGQVPQQISQFYTTMPGTARPSSCRTWKISSPRGSTPDHPPLHARRGGPGIEKAMSKNIPVIVSNRSTKTTQYVTQNTTPAVTSAVTKVPGWPSS